MFVVLAILIRMRALYFLAIIIVCICTPDINSNEQLPKRVWKFSLPRKSTSWNKKRGAWIKENAQEIINQKIIRADREEDEIISIEQRIREYNADILYSLMMRKNDEAVNSLSLFSNSMKNEKNIGLVMKKTKNHSSSFLITRNLNDSFLHSRKNLVTTNTCLYTDLLDIAITADIHFSLIGEAFSFLATKDKWVHCDNRLFRVLQKIFRKRWKFNLARSELKKHLIENVLKESVEVLLKRLKYPLLYAVQAHQDIPKIIHRVVLLGNEEQINKLMSLNLLPYELTVPGTFEGSFLHAPGSPLLKFDWRGNKHAATYLNYIDEMNSAFGSNMLHRREYNYYGRPHFSTHSYNFVVHLQQANENWKNKHFERMGAERKENICSRGRLRDLYGLFVSGIISSDDQELLCKSITDCKAENVELWNMKYHLHIPAKHALPSICSRVDIPSLMNKFLEAAVKRTNAYIEFNNNVAKYSTPQTDPTILVFDLTQKQMRALNLEKDFAIDETYYIQCDIVKKLMYSAEFTSLLFNFSLSSRVLLDVMSCGYSSSTFVYLHKFVPFLYDKHRRMAEALVMTDISLENPHPFLWRFIENSLARDAHRPMTI